MHTRITVLEDALDLQSEGSHPLLADDLISIKQVGAAEKTDGRTASELDTMTKSFGTLSISNNAMRYIGSNAAEVQSYFN